MREQWDNVLPHSLFVGLRFKGGATAKDPGGAASLEGRAVRRAAGWEGTGCEVLPAWRSAPIPSGVPACAGESGCTSLSPVIPPQDLAKSSQTFPLS